LKEEGWILDVPVYLPETALPGVMRWALPRQVDRWRSLPPGDRKDELGGAIALLKAGKITQKIVGARGDGKGDIVVLQAKPPDSRPRHIAVNGFGGA
jgi:hypothetical protein